MVAQTRVPAARREPPDALPGLWPILRWRFNYAWLGGLVALAWLAGLVQDLVLGGGDGPGKVWLLDANYEQGLLTWISVLTLFTAAQLLFRQVQDAVAQGGRPVLPWLLLSAMFTVLSLDEFFRLHERLSPIINGAVGPTGGLFFFAWAAPAGIVSLLGLALLLPFITSLGRRTATLMLVAAFVYLGGAAGLEMVGGSLAERVGEEALSYRLFVNVEEGCELLGLFLFIYALLDFRDRTSAGRAQARGASLA